ncbi:hypothetical protein T440DRAFT_394591 [Plenodomus tracheiphilus IPT5]|uniref:Utp8 beta-propeller domain-containing protein n=1 Tax=Plenodomus tracheiphilus IPT5 TaxID=1408161 RepID=A0A6A7B7H9_9PLEO|nr:hypothetical protein T440DRAFT_394591 [Plenodomus tracheiphilus IPT5]
MSSDQSIGAPFTLATLSKPVASTHGRVHAAGVCSISGVKKRKRTEIAVGLDGEGVSIYSLQNPQLVTSYALPPSATFNSAPYSIYRKGTSRTPTRRFTYASLSGSTSADKPQLVCFHEKTLGEKTETTKTFYTPSAAAQVLTLESLPVPAGGSSNVTTHDILVTFDDGLVTCLSADLQTERWSASLKALLSPDNSSVELEHVSLASARAVTKGLLRSRGDVAAILDPTPDAASDILNLTQVLCLVGRVDKSRRVVALLQVQSRSQDLITSRLSPIKHLLTWNLPGASKTIASTAHVPQSTLHASSGILHILVNGAFLSYDLSGTVPKLTSELSISGASFDAFLRISQDVLFTTAQHTCRVFDAKYNSLQALLSMEAVAATSNPTSPSKKRKHASQDVVQATAPCSLIAYYADLGLVVATRGDEIFGMQYGSTIIRKRVKTEGPLLIDAIGKGLVTKPKFSNGLDMQAWKSRKVKLGKHLSKGKIAKFEEAFAASLGIELEGGHTNSKKANEQKSGPPTNGVGTKMPDEDTMAVDNVNEDENEDAELRTWKIPKSVSHSQQQQYRQYALFALSKIFRWIAADPSQDQPQGYLKIEYFPPNVFQWLLQIGHLTKESIRRAIIEESPESIQSASIISDGDIVKALVDYDSDLHILSAVLNHSHFLPAGEVVQSIKLLLQSLDDTEEQTEAIKLLTSGNAEDEMDLDVASELEAASHEIEHALAVLDHGLAARSHTLRPALIRLHTFPAPVVSATLRSMLPRRNLESLIRLLHLELKNGGWTSPYDFVNSNSALAEGPAEYPDDHAVAIIASLLSSTLDAIGAGAWLASVGSLSTSGTTEDVIQTLRADTSEAVNGFWEARYMRGLLSEFLRYASTVPKSQRPSNKKLEQQGKPFPVTGKLDNEDLPMLPLGGKADMGIEKMKKGHGGKKEERSKREMGMLISKRVPKYSFERIVI